MADEITGTLRVVGQTYASNGARHLKLRDVDTGVEFTIYPVELFALMDGKEFTGRWRVTNKGGRGKRPWGCFAVKYLGGAE